MSTVLVTGGTGLIGKVLSGLLLQRGHSVIILTRSLPKKPEAAAGLSYAFWDVAHGTLEVEAVKKADYIVHLAGAGVADKRWTKKKEK